MHMCGNFLQLYFRKVHKFVCDILLQTFQDSMIRYILIGGTGTNIETDIMMMMWLSEIKTLTLFSSLLVFYLYYGIY